MDEQLISALSRLAKSNINVLSIKQDTIEFEYQWRTPGGQKKWSKAVCPIPEGSTSPNTTLNYLHKLVNDIRRGIE